MKSNCAAFAAILLASAGLLCNPASRADYDKGLAAYERGDHATAVLEWQAGAELGDPKSQVELGLCYANGRGVPRDDEEAVKWYRKAAESGSSSAQTNLGLMYSQGRGVPKDDAEAVKWYYKAARQGSLGSMFSLALAFEKGRGVQQNYNTAAMIYLDAAKRGHALSQANIGLLYASGVPGVPLDYGLAYKWTGLAMERMTGEMRSRLVRSREVISGHLTPVERAAIDQQIGAWQPERKPD